MVEHLDIFLYKFRFVLVGIIIAGALVVVAALISHTQEADACLAAQNSSVSAVSGGADSANVVAAGMSSAADSLTATVDTIGRRVSCNTQSVAATFSGGIKSVGSALAGSLHSFGSAMGRTSIAALHGLGHGVHGSAVFMAAAGSNSVGVVAGGLGNLTGFVSHMAVVSVTSRSPAHEQIPVIDTTAPVSFYAAGALPAAKTASQPAAEPQADTTPQWPIHGMITTAFGVPEPPYEPIHTGLDISDGWRAGVTPVYPFKPGKVVQVIHGSTGLGNHLVVDHGGGITSVYGHLYSTSVQEGQIVDKSTMLGYEGSTGVSTGTHLHFEIRVNGQPVDPHKYIPGQP